MQQSFTCFDLNLTTSGVLEVCLNRPDKLNTMNTKFFYETKEIFEMAAKNSNVKVVLLCAKVNSSFIFVFVFFKKK